MTGWWKRVWTYSAIWLGSEVEVGVYHTIGVIAGDDPAVAKAIAIFSRCLGQRCPAQVDRGTGWEFTLELAITLELEAETYCLIDIPGGVALRAGDGLGLLYGLGQFMRDGACGRLGFEPGRWRGTARPKLPLRGIYFATHFHNWYHVAPVSEIQQYVEELALWGVNTLCLWFDMHHFTGIGDPDAQEMLQRLTVVLGAAKRIGMKTAAIFLANEAYAGSPENLRADWTSGHDGYFREPGGHYHVELCPSQPAGLELILRWAEERLKAYKAVGLDYLVIWPYDQGGCTCSRCSPWGANGYLRCAEPLARLYKRHFPGGEVILSTWYFDHFIHGEWQGLADFIAGEPDWIDFLMADDYGDQFPPFLVQQGAPGGLPVVGFPEISMYRCLPWGGYGANPLPAHYQKMWNQCKGLLAGGFPYSEGIYEDINKAIFAQFYWDPDCPADNTVRSYLRYEFGAETVEPLLEVLRILESNLPRKQEVRRVETLSLENAGRAWELVRQLDAEMNVERRRLWRWRLLYRRAQIDAELARTGGLLRGDTLREAFAEITQISHAQDAMETWVRPPLVEQGSE